MAALPCVRGSGSLGHKSPPAAASALRDSSADSGMCRRKASAPERMCSAGNGGAMQRRARPAPMLTIRPSVIMSRSQRCAVRRESSGCRTRMSATPRPPEADWMLRRSSSEESTSAVGAIRGCNGAILARKAEMAPKNGAIPCRLSNEPLGRSCQSADCGQQAAPRTALNLGPILFRF